MKTRAICAIIFIALALCLIAQKSNKQHDFFKPRYVSFKCLTVRDSKFMNKLDSCINIMNSLFIDYYSQDTIYYFVSSTKQLVISKVNAIKPKKSKQKYCYEIKQYDCERDSLYLLAENSPYYFEIVRNRSPFDSECYSYALWYKKNFYQVNWSSIFSSKFNLTKRTIKELSDPKDKFCQNGEDRMVIRYQDTMDILLIENRGCGGISMVIYNCQDNSFNSIQK